MTLLPSVTCSKMFVTRFLDVILQICLLPLMWVISCTHSRAGTLTILVGSFLSLTSLLSVALSWDLTPTASFLSKVSLYHASSLGLKYFLPWVSTSFCAIRAFHLSSSSSFCCSSCCSCSCDCGCLAAWLNPMFSILLVHLFLFCFYTGKLVLWVWIWYRNVETDR